MPFWPKLAGFGVHFKFNSSLAVARGADSIFGKHLQGLYLHFNFDSNLTVAAISAIWAKWHLESQLRSWATGVNLNLPRGMLPVAISFEMQNLRRESATLATFSILVFHVTLKKSQLQVSISTCHLASCHCWAICQWQFPLKCRTAGVRENLKPFQLLKSSFILASLTSGPKKLCKK